MINSILSRELGVPERFVAVAVRLLDGGDTVPFIARYRKEATGGMDDVTLRQLADRLQYLRELEERKQVIIAAIEEQGALTDTLRALIQDCDSKARLEDLYLPYKKRRKTKADLAREAGLGPVVEELLRGKQPDLSSFHCAGFEDDKKVLEGARAILIERCSLDADCVGALRAELMERAVLRAVVVEGKEREGAKFADYFDFAESVATLPSHRILALLRGEKEGILHVSIDGGEEEIYTGTIAQYLDFDLSIPWVAEAVRWGWRTRLSVSLGLDVRLWLKERAEDKAVEVFAHNLKDVLLAAPAGPRPTLGLDPGYRNGVKCALVDGTGKVLQTLIAYPHQPQNQWAVAVRELSKACIDYGVELIAVGNGTASRETERLAREVAAQCPQRPTVVVVSEAGASVYSASEVASREFPTMDVSLRGAVSIARRLQDPLAELVKIDPKAIGVGQYQHDVNQTSLARALDAVVEDAVNGVGVDVNTASAALLSRVAGITSSLADSIVRYRDEHGRFDTREELSQVPRLGPRAFEQAAGFLRIMAGSNPLDASAVHPEAYEVVHAIAGSTGVSVHNLIGNTKVLSRLRPADYATDTFGVPTITDILAELDKPGRDPRPEFRTASFAEGVETIHDLAVGMRLEGTVTNVAAFGAFVDIGVHQDGLVHISALADRFVRDPHEVVRSGQVVRVTVTDVDTERGRISLSMRQLEKSR